VRPRLRPVFVVAVVLAAAFGPRLTIFRPQLVPVTVFRAARGKVEETVTNSKAGTIKSRLRSTLSPEVGGRVEELRARKGEPVHRGDVLMRIAATDRNFDYRRQWG
jgi:HlyD family secretion protein